MIHPSEKYFAKLLLFGEYGLICNSMALSVPYNAFSGQLAFDSERKYTESTNEIRKFAEFLKSNEGVQNYGFKFDLNKLDSDLQQGLYFSSSIPQQYGVGSSGALVAALYGKYQDDSERSRTQTPENLKAGFSVLESYFHGKSSGLDPLISYLNQAILIDADQSIKAIDFKLVHSGLAFALIDTQTTGATEPLVRHFLGLLESPEFKDAFYSQFIRTNNSCIQNLIAGKTIDFLASLEELIHFQLMYFDRMIPQPYHKIIARALNEQVYIKLLGSGGGGFLIAFAKSDSIIQAWAAKNGISVKS